MKVEKTHETKNMYHPIVSVVMSVYNESEDMLRKAIESILNQTYIEFEFIIILDNPNNMILLDVIQSYRNDSRVKVLVNEKNVGLPASLNRGIKESKGKYICRMDADDVSFPTRIQSEVEFMEQHPKYDLVYSARTNIDENGTVIKTRQAYPKNDKSVYKCLKYDSPITHPTVMMKKESVLSAGGYRPYFVAEDFDLWRRIIDSGGEIGYIETPLLYYRIRSGSATVRNNILQHLTRYFIVNNSKGSVFSKSDYEMYINNHICDKKYSRVFQRYETGLKNRNIIIVFLYSLIYKELRFQTISVIGFHMNMNVR